MSQGDKRLVWNLRERIISADLMRSQALAAAEKAGRLRSQYDDALGDWWSAGGFQLPVISSTPSLVGDVYGGLMVQPDNAGYYLISPGAIGVLEPSGLGPDDSPYRVIVDPGVSTAGVLPFTSNAAGASPRWDVVECQPVDRALDQQSRSIYNPATGIASPVLVDKVRAGQLNYRVRVGTVGAGFPGVAAGWLPLAVVCAPAGSSSLLTSDVWDVRPLVRERTRLSGPVTSGSVVAYCPLNQAEYRFRLIGAAGANCWVGAAESSFNGYVAGGKLERSTPSTLAQFGGTDVTGGRAGLMNTDLADNQSTYTLGTNVRVNLVAVFPAFLPRWQRYSQVPVGSGRVPSGPRGILLATTSGPNSNGTIGGIPLPAAMSFGVGATASGCLLGSAHYKGAAFAPGHATGAEHYAETQFVAANSIGPEDIDFDLSPNVLFPGAAPRRLLVQVSIVANNGSGTLNPDVLGRLMMGSEFYGTFMRQRLAGAVSSSSNMEFQCWAPCLPRSTPTDQNLPGTTRLRFTLLGIAPSITSATLQVLAWSSSDR